jgi:hypothetical protein
MGIRGVRTLAPRPRLTPKSFFRTVLRYYPVGTRLSEAPTGCPLGPSQSRVACERLATSTLAISVLRSIR